jgi:hypothetical protein
VFTKRSILFLSAAILIALVNACSSPNETHFSGVLLPLAAGNSWQYETHTINGLTGKDSVGSDSAFVTFAVDFNGQQYMFYNFPGTHGSSPAIVRNGQWGLYEFDDANDTELLPFQFPADNSYRYDWVNFEDIAGETATVIDNREIISVPAGTFSTVHYYFQSWTDREFPRTTWEGDDYFALNIGVVKSVDPLEVTDSNGIFVRTDTVIAMLKSYHLNY